MIKINSYGNVLLFGYLKYIKIKTMKEIIVKLPNFVKENLDVLLKDNAKSDIIIVCVHGFGSNKRENFDLLEDIACALAKDYEVLQFSFSGYGESEGKQEDVCLSKMRDDLLAVLNYAKILRKRIFLIAHSMGTFVTTMLMPDRIEKVVFTSPPNANTEIGITNLQKRIISAKGGLFDENGVSIYPRTSGEVQKLGGKYWEELRSFDPIQRFSDFAEKTKLVIFRPDHDEVIQNGGGNDYVFAKLNPIQLLRGDHNFTNKEERAVLIGHIKSFFRS